MRTNLLNCRMLSKLWMFAGLLLVSSTGFAQSGGGDTKAGIGALANSSNNKIIKLEVTQSNYQATKIVPSVANGTWVEYDLWITSENTQYYSTGFSGTYRSTSSNLTFTFQDNNNNNCLGANDYLEWGSPAYNPSTNTYDYFIGMFSEENTSCTPIVTLSQASGNYGIQANIDQYGGTKLDYWDNGTIYSSGTLPTVNMPWGTAVAVSGNGNSALGYYAGAKITSGQKNTLVGFEAGNGLIAGSNNTIIGSDSWEKDKNYQPFTGSNNIVIGTNISNIEGTTSDALIIANGDYGVKLFSPSNNNLYLGYGMTTPSTTFKLDVNGAIRSRSASGYFTIANNNAGQSAFSDIVTSFPRFVIEKGRGSQYIPTALQSNDVTGSLLFKGYQGSTVSSHDVASITSNVQTVTSPGIFGSAMKFAVRKAGASGTSALSDLFELNADGYAKATEKFKIGSVSSGSSSDEILVRSTSDGEVKTRSVSDVLGGASETFQSITDRGNYTTQQLKLKAASSPNPNTSGADKAYNSVGFYNDDLGIENSRLESFYHNGQYVDRGGLKFYNRDGNGLQPRLTITSNGSLILGNKEDKWNAAVPVGAVTGGYNIDFHTWRDAEPDQIGGRIRAERLNVWQHNSPLVQGTDLAFSTSDGWEQTHLTERLRIKYNGNVGIGTLNPAAKLQVYDGNFFISRMSHEYAPTVDLAIGDSDTGIDWIGDGVFSLKTDDVEVQRFDHGKVIFASSSKIGIGTGSATLTEALNVNGNILTEGVKVNPTEFPDYVFKPQYKLPSLKDVENFVKENSHLPEVPSEAEVKKNGLELGEMSVILLKKVEELTLYMIEKDKQLEKANQRIEELSKKVDKLSKK